MSVISICRTHRYPLDELRSKIEAIKENMEHRFEFHSEWETNRNLLFRRKGIKGNIEIDESNFKLNLSLSIMYRSMKADIKEEIIVIVDRNLL